MCAAWNKELMDWPCEKVRRKPPLPPHLMFDIGQRVEALYRSKWYDGEVRRIRPYKERRYVIHCDVDPEKQMTNLREFEIKAICLLKNSVCWCQYGDWYKGTVVDVRRVRLSDVSSTKTNRSIAQVHDGGMSYTIKCETLVQNLDKNYQKVRRPVPFTLPKWPAVKVRRVSPFQKPFKFHVGQRISVK